MKAREIIPGWPRGRSTSRPCAAGSVWPWQYAYSIISGELLHVGNRTEWQGLGRKPYLKAPFFDHANAALDCAARAEDLERELAEERRKGDMMKVYWQEQQILARGPLCPEPYYWYNQLAINLLGQFS